MDSDIVPILTFQCWLISTIWKHHKNYSVTQAKGTKYTSNAAYLELCYIIITDIYNLLSP